MHAVRKLEEWKFQAPWRKENTHETEQEQAEGEFNVEIEELKRAEKIEEQQQMQEAREKLILEANLRYRMF